MKCTVADDDHKRLMLDILKRAYQGSDSDGSDSDAGDSDDGGGDPHDDALHGVLSKETMQKLMLKVDVWICSRRAACLGFIFAVTLGAVSTTASW
jgi:hypothetical protein